MTEATGHEHLHVSRALKAPAAGLRRTTGGSRSPRRAVVADHGTCVVLPPFEYSLVTASVLHIAALTSRVSVRAISRASLLAEGKSG